MRSCYFFSKAIATGLCLLLLPALINVGVVFGQGTAISYQGRLTDAGVPANGNYDFEVKLFDTAGVGTGAQQGATLQRINVTVVNGNFNLSLDFGSCASCFNGADRFLEIGVKPTSGGVFTTLGPRQPISSTPYALKSVNATIADGLSVTCVNCITSTQIASVNGSAVTGAIPLASVPSGSDKYVQNSVAQQVLSNFNISGDGTAGGSLSANLVNAGTQFNLGGQRVLAVTGTSPNLNTFLGFGAGAANTTGTVNSFFGRQAGANNTTGGQNSFFGGAAGEFNTTGTNNSFFGLSAGRVNTASSNNSFFGTNAGSASTGSNNAFFGSSTAIANTSGSENSFFGMQSGRFNTTGANNSFVGRSAGFNNSSGGSNAFLGFNAGMSNTSGNNNTVIGANANVGVANLDHATAIGADSVVGASNTIVLGRSGGADTIQIPGALTVTGNLNVNVVNVSSQYNIGGERIIGSDSALRNTFVGALTGFANPSVGDNSFFGYQAGTATNFGGRNSFFGSFAGLMNNLGSDNSFFGSSAGAANTGGFNNSFFGSGAGIVNNSGGGNSFFGAFAGNDNLSGLNNAFFGASAGTNNTTGNNNTIIGGLAGPTTTTGLNLTVVGSSADVGVNNLTNASAIGSRARVDQSNSLVLGSINGINGATADTKVGVGTTTPGAVLDVQRDGGSIAETVRLTTYGADNEFLSRASGGSRTTPTATPSSRNLLILGGTGHDGTNFSSSFGGSVNIIATEAWTSTAHGTRISFRTTPNGSTGILTRMTVADDGNVGIGTTGPSAALEVRGDVKLGPSGQYFAAGGNENLRVLRGMVRSDGGIDFGGDGFTSSRLATGHYRITFTTPFPDVPTITVSAFTGGPDARIASWTAPSPGSFEVRTYTITGTAVDCVFNIIIVGPR